MAKTQIVHAPTYNQHGVKMLDKPISVSPMCNTTAAEPRVAEPGELTDCKACLSALWDRPQWLHHLMAKGYEFPRGRRPPKPSRKKKDERQMSFGDMFGDDDA